MRFFNLPQCMYFHVLNWFATTIFFLIIIDTCLNGCFVIYWSCLFYQLIRWSSYIICFRFLGSTQESSNIVTLLQSMISQIYRFFKLPEHKTQVSHNGFGSNRGNVEGHLSLNVYIEYRVYQYWGVFCLFVFFFGFFKIFFFLTFSKIFHIQC